MVAVERLLTMILASVLLTTKTGVEGSKDTCPSKAIVDLTGEEQDDSGSINKTGIIFTSNATWEENGRTFGCPCHFKTCIPFCCPLGHALSKDGCVEDEVSPDLAIYEQHGSGSFHGFSNDPCHQTTTDPASWIKNYDIFNDGSVGVNISSLQIIDWERYCLIRPANSRFYEMGVCDDKVFQIRKIWAVSCLSVSSLIMMAIFVVYSVTPELKNLQGSIFRCYLISYIGCMLLLIMFVIFCSLLEWSLPAIFANLTVLMGLYYFGTACILWLNVMSFDIWQKFRKFRAHHDGHNKKNNTAKFFRYSIYVWGSSAVAASTPWILLFMKQTGSLAILYVLISPAAFIAICNTCLFTLTAFNIKQWKKETSHMADGVDKHQKQNEQWFNLYVKLFIIMGGPMIIWVVALWLQNKTLLYIVYALEVVQAILIFLIFVWKDDVKKSFGKRFNETMRSLSFRFRRRSTPTTED